MPEIDVSEDQIAYLEELRAALAAAVPYGHVRHRDALQYLVDCREGEVDTDLQTALDGVGDSTADVTSDAIDATADAGTSRGGGAVTTESNDRTTDETDEPTEPTADPASGNDRLQAMMSLLDTYDEHWRESEAEDARYEVSLPDGSVEYARTKDDVRSLLFKHYR
ncbi:hypothetical protein [Halospeciosus flavus]|uniref:Uncharacterized protein n=1 Tax=Halospeciosus flavus TaxID=3032283 RepID=A0ABD5Z6K9_9EURY|nr:hypothetical protein [Halospeciosus flavus]